MEVMARMKVRRTPHTLELQRRFYAQTGDLTQDLGSPLVNGTFCGVISYPIMSRGYPASIGTTDKMDDRRTLCVFYV